MDPSLDVWRFVKCMLLSSKTYAWFIQQILKFLTGIFDLNFANIILISGISTVGAKLKQWKAWRLRHWISQNQNLENRKQTNYRIVRNRRNSRHYRRCCKKFKFRFLLCLYFCSTIYRHAYERAYNRKEIVAVKFMQGGIVNIERGVD